MSERQQQIYDYIKNHINEKQYPPTMREISAATGFKSVSTVHGHLVNMRKKKYINFMDSLPRTISIVD